jgi:hypothetical protein
LITPRIRPVWRTCCDAHAISPPIIRGARFAARVQAILQQALALRDRRAAGTISPHGVAIARGRLLAQLLVMLDTPGRLPAMRRFAAHLIVELQGLFSFLFDPTIDATNWRAEQALRPAVVNRKVCGGNRSDHGADTQQVLASVIRTARQRGFNAGQVLVDLLHARRPEASPALQSRVQ